MAKISHFPIMLYYRKSEMGKYPCQLVRPSVGEWFEFSAQVRKESLKSANREIWKLCFAIAWTKTEWNRRFPFFFRLKMVLNRYKNRLILKPNKALFTTLTFVTVSGRSGLAFRRAVATNGNRPPALHCPGRFFSTPGAALHWIRAPRVKGV